MLVLAVHSYAATTMPYSYLLAQRTLGRPWLVGMLHMHIGVRSLMPLSRGCITWGIGLHLPCLAICITALLWQHHLSQILATFSSGEAAGADSSRTDFLAGIVLLLGCVR